MPKKGEGRRPQTNSRAATAYRKAAHLVQKWTDKEQEELVGIAQGIMCDRHINYIEYPYNEACKQLVTNRAQLNKLESKVKKQYSPQPPPNWDRRKYRRPKSGKPYTTK